MATLKKRLFSFMVSFLLISVCTSASDWNNFIINYNKNLYGRGSQTWQINAYNDNWVYFANKNGVLQFNGDSWEVFPMNNGSDVRSVLPSVSQKRIYAGGINEFGYFEPAPDGRLVYTCMSDSLDIATRAIGNVWGIHENDNILYLQGDGRVLKYLNGKYTTIEMDCKIDCSDMVNGVLYIGTDHGVWVLVGNTFFPLQGAKTLISKRIRSIIPYREGVLVVTAYHGLYYCDGHTTVPFLTGVEDFMRQNEVFCAATSGHKIALGTVHKGLLLIDLQTRQVKYFNEYNGLQNNTVLSVAFDYWGNLWAGLDSGIDYVCLNSSFTNLYSYPYSYGTGYTALLSGDRLYLGTNRGLYYTHYPVQLTDNLPDIHPVHQSSGQVWNLCRIGDDLFCLHDRGVFLVEENAIRKIADIAGAWACQPVAGKEDLLYVGVYDGLYLMQKSGGNWKVLFKIKGLIDSCRFFEQESATLLWICSTDNVMRVELSDDLSQVTGIQSYNKERGFPSGRDIRVSKIDGKICFTTPEGIYRYNEQADRMEPFPEMNAMLNGANAYSQLIQYNSHLISLSQQEICIANLRSYKKGAEACIVPIELPSVELVQGAEAIIPLSDSLLVIPDYDGFALFKVPSTKHQADYNKLMHIRNVYLSYPKDSLIYTDNFLALQDRPEIGYKQNSIRFEYAISSFTHGEEVRYQYRLNDHKWSDYATVQTKEYSNLREGDYTFEVKAVFPNGATATDRFSFRILPPWYRTVAAYVCYFILFLMAMWCLYRWDDLRVKRKKQQAVVEKDKELQELEKEYEEENARKERQIVELEKEKLEYELKHKSQEMANLMINFVRKSEMLTEIKSDLFKVITALKGEGAKEYKKMLLLVSNKIDSNIQSDDVLKRIEEQFDLVHNNFMKRLGEKHPDLSLNERMMCAYLKMNLSTKEIAPLLGISVRGVETIRYRLRKKFELEREDSLIDYLNQKI